MTVAGSAPASRPVSDAIAAICACATEPARWPEARRRRRRPLPPPEAAARLAAAEETVHSVLKRVFSELDVSRQAELTALLTPLAAVDRTS